jgi:hypothetical protein
MQKTLVTLTEGITLVCLHHKYTMSPFMQLNLDKLVFKHNMMYDHDIIEGIFDSAVVYDLSMWPKTLNPIPFRESASAIRKKILGFKSPDHKFEVPHNLESLEDYINNLDRQEIIGIKDHKQSSGITLNTKLFYANCPLQT